jgi:hypothetical protein
LLAGSAAALGKADAKAATRVRLTMIILGVKVMFIDCIRSIS